jgi:hypothetical protein
MDGVQVITAQDSSRPTEQVAEDKGQAGEDKNAKGNNGNGTTIGQTNNKEPSNAEEKDNSVSSVSGSKSSRSNPDGQ